jgi:Flp pilus assembly protein TadD
MVVVRLLCVVAAVGLSLATLAAAQPATDPEQRARALFDAERYGEAAEALQRIIAERPGDRTANILLSFALARAGQHDLALQQARRALDLFPDNLQLRLLLAGLLGRQEPTRTEAIRHYEIVLQRDPENELARLGLAEIARAQGRVFDAIHHFEWLAERHPDDARYSVRLGQQHATLGDLGRARAEFERAYAIEPHNVDAVRSLAILGDVEDRPQDSVRFYRELLALFPADVSVQIAVRRAEQRLAEPQFPVPVDQMERTPLETYVRALPTASRQLVHRAEQLEATRLRGFTRFLPSFFVSPSSSTVTRTPGPALRDESQALSFSFGWNLPDIFANPYNINITGMKADYEAIRASLTSDVSAMYYQRLQSLLEYRRLQRALALNPHDEAVRQGKQNVKYTILHLTERLKILTGMP